MESLFQSKQEFSSTYVYKPVFNMICKNQNTIYDSNVTIGEFEYTNLSGKYYETPIATQWGEWIFILERMNKDGRSTFLNLSDDNTENHPWFLCAIHDGNRYNAGGFVLSVADHIDFMIDFICTNFWQHLYSNLSPPDEVHLAQI